MKSSVVSPPLLRLAITVALGAVLASCVEANPVLNSRTFTVDTYAGYALNVPRTVDAGATIAHQVETTDVNPLTESDLVLGQPCKVVDHALLDNIAGTRTLTLRPGPLHVDATIASPTELLLQRFPGNPGKGSALYLAVQPDGTISDRLWTGWPTAQGLDQNVAKISLVPADCRYVRSTAIPASPSAVRRRTGVLIVYAGRDPSGLLRFAEEAGGMAMQQVLAPAQPGQYDVLGLRMQIIAVNGYKVTYEVQSPAASQ